MSELNESDYEAFYEDLKILVDTLQKVFNSEQSRYYFNDESNTLYVEIEGLDELSDEEIEEVANPVLEELDLDLDEVILLPYR